MTRKKIAVFLGSLRKESFNHKMAMALLQVSPDSLEPEIVEIGALPFTTRISMAMIRRRRGLNFVRA